MKLTYLLLFSLAIWRVAFGQEELKFSAELSSDNPLKLNCSVKNTTASCVIVLFKESLGEDGARWAFINARYYSVVLFPDGDAGERVEECFGYVSGAYPSIDTKSLIKLKPGEVYHFSREVVSNNEKLIARLRSESFFLYWYVAINYKVVCDVDNNGTVSQKARNVTGRYNGFCRKGISEADLADQPGQPDEVGPRH